MGYRPTQQERDMEGQWWVIEVPDWSKRFCALFDGGRFQVDGVPWSLDEVRLVKRVHLDDLGTQSGETYEKGDTFQEGSDGIYTAGIHVDAWVHRIECYGKTPEEAEALRDRVLAALQA